MMISEEQKLKHKRYSRIKRIKWLLRPLPRKSNLHRYPFLKFFAIGARKRAYLWSFRVEDVIPSLYVGWILTFLPLYGMQLPLALGAALILRSNLPVIVGLVMISNPLTVPLIYWLAYYTGNLLLEMFVALKGGIDVNTITVSPTGIRKGVHWFLSMVLGGSLIGYVAAVISSVIYRMAAARAESTLFKIRENKIKDTSLTKLNKNVSNDLKVSDIT